ncbi:MAG: glycosyltransferase family 39 protein [Patescibacteria group bacterium]|nr:glycosyltransferase family 39 protein [Patescibacteria group bacterium]
MNRFSILIGKGTFFFVLFIGLILWSIWIIQTHLLHAIVSWDEGFHGGSALFISESLMHPLSVKSYLYIAQDFINGLIWYLPLWSISAGVLGSLLGPSVSTYRLATLIFACLSIFIIALFTKKLAGSRAGLTAAVTLAFAPIFIIYSHLMMIEVPLLFSTSLALLSFYRYLSKDKLTAFDYWITVLAFVIGTATKVTAVAIINGTVIIFGVFLFLFFKKSLFWKRFYSLWTAVFLGSSLGIFLGYCLITHIFLKVDMISFYLQQTRQLSTDNSNIALLLLKTLLTKITYYLRDFSHMLPLTVGWWGSLLAYIISKRSIISFYLAVWAIVSYLIFSSVQPQSPQYLLPIFTPLAIAVGLFWGDFFAGKNKLVNGILFIVFNIGLIWLNLVYLDKSEVINWRNQITSQDQAVMSVVAKVNPGDRVFSIGDGTRFLLQLSGISKNLQTINGASFNCKKEMQESSEWIIFDHEFKQLAKLTPGQGKNWVETASFSGSEETIEVLHHINFTGDLTIEGKGLSIDCPRLLLLGKNEIIIYATPYLQTNVNLDKDLKIVLQARKRKNKALPLAELTVNKEDLKKQEGKEQIYKVFYNQKEGNQFIFTSFEVPEGLNFKIRKIEIIPL